MAKEYEQTQAIGRTADEALAWLSEAPNLPHYLPPIKNAGVEGRRRRACRGSG